MQAASCTVKAEPEEHLMTLDRYTTAHDGSFCQHITHHDVPATHRLHTLTQVPTYWKPMGSLQ